MQRCRRLCVKILEKKYEKKYAYRSVQNSGEDFAFILRRFWSCVTLIYVCLDKGSSIYSRERLRRSKMLPLDYPPCWELAVTYFTDLIRKEADNGKATGAVFIDLSKAFDTISHSVLLSKLSRYGVNDMELQWFTDYLFLRKQIVQFNGVLSDPNPINTGVPQGSILGPLLFLIFFNDVHSPLRHCKIITYADDTVISTSSSDIDVIQSNLSQDLHNLSNWFRDNELIFNLKKGKSEVMLFGTGKRLNLLQGCQVKLSVNDSPINATICYKYLGVHLDPTLNFETHFQKMYKKAAGRVNLLRRIRSSIDTLSAQLTNL